MTLSAYCWQLALEFRKREPHVFSPRNLGHGGFIKWRTSKSFNIWMWFFPSASERRVLLIVGVWYTSSHLHIFTSSHRHICTYHLHIFASSHLILTYHHRIFASSHLHISSSHLRICTSSHIIFTSSHLHIFTSYPHIFSLSLPLIPSLSLSFSLSCPLSQSISFFFLFSLQAAGGADEAPRNGHLSHEMRFDRQKL